MYSFVVFEIFEVFELLRIFFRVIEMLLVEVREEEEFKFGILDFLC